MSISLKSLKYFEHRGRSLEWSIDTLLFRNVNLIVGKNSAGKSRAVSVIWSLAESLLRRKKLAEAGYDVVFIHDGVEIGYKLVISGGTIQEEVLTIDGEVKIHRDSEQAHVWYQQLDIDVVTKPQKDEIVASRTDDIQHPYLAPLHMWANGVRFYSFGKDMGKSRVAIFVDEGPEVDERDEDAVVALFRKASRTLGPRFKESVLADMRSLNYTITDVDVRPLESVRGAHGDVHGLALVETGVEGWIEHLMMSQGMFRALSVIVQVTYSQMTNRVNCILIDDIGEGLDFERSAILIEMLRNKSTGHEFQLVMTTNDQFVMNHVPLEEWSLLHRKGNHVHVRNAENSQEEFENFRFVGLSNFTFFEMDLIDAPKVEALCE